MINVGDISLEDIKDEFGIFIGLEVGYGNKSVSVYIDDLTLKPSDTANQENLDGFLIEPIYTTLSELFGDNMRRPWIEYQVARIIIDNMRREKFYEKWH